MYIERNLVSGRFETKDFVESDSDDKNVTVWVISGDVKTLKPYTYDEAISLSGHGRYSIGLLLVCCLSLLAMSLDMFGFTVVVTGSSCDLHIELWQQNILLSIPYLGAMSMAYVWGYISDTRGRRLSLVIAMWGSFFATTLSVFSPNWIVLAVLKFISVSLCSCAQSATFTLIGECCPIHLKRVYLFILSSVSHLIIPIYTALAYASQNMSFEIDLIDLPFTPWRLLILLLALPLGISGVSLHYFDESPKFLVNIGENRLALDVLRRIWRRNRCVGKRYPVEQLIFEEEGNIRSRNVSFLQSMWDQTVPLFKMPFLLRTLQLYFLVVVMFSTTNSLMTWFPILSTAFISGLASDTEVSGGLCSIVEHSQNLTDVNDRLNCIPKSDGAVVWSSAVQGIILVIINIAISQVSSRKLLVIVIMIIMTISSAGCAFIEDNLITLILFYTIFLGVIVTGILSTYFVDMYPTSYRGMAACLSVFLARGSGLLGTNLTGLYIMTHCTNTFYIIAGNVLCGALVACFLPSERAKL